MELHALRRVGEQELAPQQVPVTLIAVDEREARQRQCRPPGECQRQPAVTDGQLRLAQREVQHPAQGRRITGTQAGQFAHLQAPVRQLVEADGQTADPRIKARLDAAQALPQRGTQLDQRDLQQRRSLRGGRIMQRQSAQLEHRAQPLPAPPQLRQAHRQAGCRRQPRLEAGPVIRRQRRQLATEAHPQRQHDQGHQPEGDELVPEPEGAIAQALPGQGHRQEIRGRNREWRNK